MSLFFYLQIGIKEKLAVVMFNSIKAAVTRQHQLTQTLSPLGYKVTYMGAGEMVVTVAEISPQKPVASSGHATETTSTPAAPAPASAQSQQHAATVPTLAPVPAPAPAPAPAPPVVPTLHTSLSNKWVTASRALSARDLVGTDNKGNKSARQLQGVAESDERLSGDSNSSWAARRNSDASQVENSARTASTAAESTTHEAAAAVGNNISAIYSSGTDEVTEWRAHGQDADSLRIENLDDNANVDASNNSAASIGATDLSLSSIHTSVNMSTAAQSRKHEDSKTTPTRDNSKRILSVNATLEPEPEPVVPLTARSAAIKRLEPKIIQVMSSPEKNDREKAFDTTENDSFSNRALTRSASEQISPRRHVPAVNDSVQSDESSSLMGTTIDLPQQPAATSKSRIVVVSRTATMSVSPESSLASSENVNTTNNAGSYGYNDPHQASSVSPPRSHHLLPTHTTPIPRLNTRGQHASQSAQHPHPQQGGSTPVLHRSHTMGVGVGGGNSPRGSSRSSRFNLANENEILSVLQSRVQVWGFMQQ
jgi:hypothetical protein